MADRTEMELWTRAGRQAIEYRLLGVLIRPRAFNEDDDKELAAIRKLLADYDRMMADFLPPGFIDQAANDPDGRDV